MIDQSKYEALLLRARKRFQQVVQAEAEIRREAEIDLSFLAGYGQWDEKVRRDRERGPSPRPCLVFNKVLPPVTQLGNQARQNKPAIQVSPVDSAGDPDTAKVLQGMVRHIEYDSDADQAYDTALFYAAGCSFGYWRYTCEYTSDSSFDQDIKAVSVDDPFSIYLDCFARKPDRSDMKWAFVIDTMPKDAHEARFGEDVAELSADFEAQLTDEGWRDDDTRRVAEYWEVDSEKKTLRLRKAEDGTVHPEYLEDLEDEEIDSMEWVREDEDDPESKPREREVEIPRVMQYIINGARVLEEPTRWDGSTIPIVMVTGLEMVVRGKKKIFSMTRFARDPQQLLNFYKTMEAETISLAPKPKWLGAVGQFKSKRKDWQRANTDNAAYLEYDPIAVGDKMAPPPHWEVFDPPVQALSIGAAACTDDIKASTGYFDPSLGEIKGDQSGIAIGKLQKQGDVSNFHFMDNLARGLKRGGRIVVELIPKKYDTAREVRIIGEDQKQLIVKVNQPGVDDKGKPYHHKLDQGKYDVQVQQGPSYSTARAETREMIMALAQGNPEVWQLAADVFFENQDFVGADRLAKRFHDVLPPAVLAQEGNDQNQNVPPQVQAQIAQLQQALQVTQLQNQQMADLLKTKILDLQSRERIADQNNQRAVFVAEATAKSKLMNDQAERDHDHLQGALDRRADLLRTSMDIQADAFADQQERIQQQQQLQQQQQSEQQQRAHEAGLQNSDQQHEQQLQQQQQEAAAVQPPAPAKP